MAKKVSRRKRLKSKVGSASKKVKEKKKWLLFALLLIILLVLLNINRIEFKIL